MVWRALENSWNGFTFVLLEALDIFEQSRDLIKNIFYKNWFVGSVLSESHDWKVT